MENTSKVVRFDPAIVEKAELDIETQELLLRSGLLQIRMNGEDILGIRFDSQPNPGLIRAEDGLRMLLPIGYEWDEKTAILGLEAGTGILYRIDVQTGECAVVNSSIHRFMEFLHRYASFIHEHSKQAAPSVMTLEQAQAKLEAFRRGEIKPRSQHSDRSARDQALKDLRLFYTEKDPVSVLNEETWWSVVLEQVEDGVL